MFHITPTPTSWMLWAAIYVVAALAIAGIAFLSISFDNRILYVPIVLIGIVVVGLSVSSYYHNYTNSSSYNRAKKDLKIEYDMNMRRTIIVKDIMGKNVYEYTGSFSYILKGQKIDLTDNKTGEKISVYIGDNNTVIVTDAGIKGEKK